MKKKVQIYALFITLLSLTQFSMAEIQSSEEQVVESSEAKPLKVEKGATKFEEEEKTRSLILEYSNNTAETNANMNIGKVEFYVK
jgi:hypothetical protein